MRFTSLAEVAECLGFSVADKLVTHFSCDSRVIEGGGVFFALRGQRVDGYDFLQEVARKGGVGAVVDREGPPELLGMVLLPVHDVVASLQRLALELQKRRKQQIVAVTGSVGKTTTKEFLATLLEQKYTVAKTPGNHNSQVGVPLAILNDLGIAQYFVAEMGMSRRSEIATLVAIAPPDLAVITKITHQHQKNFPDGIEGIAAAKGEILQHRDTKAAVIHYGAMGYSVIRDSSCKICVTFGMERDRADFVLLPAERTRSEAAVYEWEVWQEGKLGCSVRLPFSEPHLCENVIAAVAAGRFLGLDWGDIVEGASKLKVPKLRFERREKEGILWINDCYNADPESMEAALTNLPSPSMGGRKIAVLGAMTELGSYTEEGHKRVGQVALAQVDHLFCYGKECLPMVELFSHKGKPADLFYEIEELKMALLQVARKGDVILLKGANAHRLWRVLEDIEEA